MTQTLVRPKAQMLQAWQYTKNNEPPLWVLDALKMADDNTLLVDRSTGLQALYYGEWLLKERDKKDLIHCTDAEYRRDYEAVK